MKYEIVEMIPFSGRRAKIYSVVLKDDHTTLFDYFLMENLNSYRSEINSIINRLIEIGQRTGVRASFFKQFEGKPGDGVCALFDIPESKLRLYCIRYGNGALIVGGGGPKPRSIRAWQEDRKLSIEVNRMIRVSADILERLCEKDLKWSRDGRTLLGNLNFMDDEKC